ncbi:fructosamine kinase family protein [Vibrio sp. WXL210]|uniref:fructosamine kinase family protein n=1 Tax=Vibrio sp. WXL210 TaxID=3450709 RepID=UPI003EC848F8
MWRAIEQAISERLGAPFVIKEHEKITGGDINQAYVFGDGEQRFFAKVNDKSHLERFQLEAEQLDRLQASNTVQVPDLIAVGHSKQHAWLILEYLVLKPLDSCGGSYEFGSQLAQLHRWGEQKEYGYDVDNFIGATFQPNTWMKNWSHFFSEQRIGWQLQLLKEKGVHIVDLDEFVELVHQKLLHHNPRPSLLHGDLWHGNAAQSVAGPVMYDPACYWGDRECDIAMTELFGGFDQRFYQGYNDEWQLDKSYPQRQPIYQLYHLLNHLNLFGGDYLSQTQKLIDKIMRAD